MEKCLKAGVAKVDITCRTDMALDAVLPERSKAHLPPELLGKKLEISDPLYARALVLDDGAETIVLLTMDVTAIGARTITQDILSDSADDFLPRLRKKIEDGTGIPGANISACATHAHGVPRMLCDDEEQLERCAAAVAEAYENRVPVRALSGSGSESALTFNRTMMMKDGTDYTLRSCNPPPPDEDVAGLRPIDPEIGILRFDRVADGSPLALVYNFGTHLLLGPPRGEQGLISADHVGVTLSYLEESIGQGIMAFFLQGAGGDVAEINKSDTCMPTGSLEFGRKMGQSVLEGCRNLREDKNGLRIVREHVRFPLRKDIPQVIADLERAQVAEYEALRYTGLNFKTFLPLYIQRKTSREYPAHSAYRYLHADACGNTLMRIQDERNARAVEKYLDSMRRMERMARNTENIATLRKHREVIEELATESAPAEIQGVRIGDTVLIVAPFEALAETVLRVKSMSPFKRTFVVSISNGYLHYAPPAEYYPRGGYEVTECLLAPEWEPVFFSALERIFADLA